MMFKFVIVRQHQNGRKMTLARTFAVRMNFVFKKITKILKFYFLVGACCGASETDGCVDNLLFKDCDASSEWSLNETCSNVCGN